MSAIEEMIDGVAEELSWLPQPPVFLGGATIGLYLDDFGRSQVRATKDVDCIVPGVDSRAAWWALEHQLQAAGWTPDATGPLCRYRSPGGTLVDLMSTDPEVLGFAGLWYWESVGNAEPRSLSTGRDVLVPRPEHLLACKLEAWNDRGKSDPMVSNDLEDIASLLDGCKQLEDGVAGATDELRGWIGHAFGTLLNTPAFREALIGQLPRGGAQREREQKVLALMARLAVP